MNHAVPDFPSPRHPYRRHHIGEFNLIGLKRLPNHIVVMILVRLAGSSFSSALPSAALYRWRNPLKSMHAHPRSALNGLFRRECRWGKK